MPTECPTCHLSLKDESTQRCPRCHTTLNKPPRCEECKGCSFFRKCPESKTAPVKIK